MAKTLNITNIPVGNSTLATLDNGKQPNRAVVLRMSYVDLDEITETQQDESLVWSGIPLSLSSYYSKNVEQSFYAGKEAGEPFTPVVQVQQYYALDIILYNPPEDFPNPADKNFPTSPDSRTFTLNGSRLSAHANNYRYYLHTSVIAASGTKARSKFIFNGMPLGKGRNGELLLRNSGLAFDDIDEEVNMMVGGLPLSVGRINARGKNYLIIVPV